MAGELIDIYDSEYWHKMNAGERAQNSGFVLFRQLFKREMHSTMVNNLHRCGVLSENMRRRLEEELRVNVAEHLAYD